MEKELDEILKELEAAEKEFEKKLNEYNALENNE